MANRLTTPKPKSLWSYHTPQMQENRLRAQGRWQTTGDEGTRVPVYRFAVSPAGHIAVEGLDYDAAGDHYIRLRDVSLSHFAVERP